jgi:hypothetical protein
VVALKTFPPLQRVCEEGTHCAGTFVLLPGQQTSPGAQQAVVTAPFSRVAPAHVTAQAQWKLVESQKCVQHCESEVQFSSESRHGRLWLAAALGARTAESTPAAAVAARSLKKLRREVLVASALLSWSNPSALIAVPPAWYIASGGNPPCFGLGLTSTPSFPLASSYHFPIQNIGHPFPAKTLTSTAPILCLISA